MSASGRPEPKRGSLGDLLSRAGVPVREGTADGSPGDPASDPPDTAGARSRGRTGADAAPSGAVHPAADGALDLPGAGKIVLRRERKGRGGKTVTVVSGLPPRSHDAVARAMRKAFGCGATVEGSDVVLLGDLGDRAKPWLEERGARKVVLGN